MATDVAVQGLTSDDRLSCFRLAEALKNRYVLYTQKYVKIRDPERLTWLDEVQHKSPTTTEKHKLENIYLVDHIRGDYAVAVFAGPKATKFICFDVDTTDPSITLRVIDTLAQLGIPRDRIYVSLSGSKGYHVDIFAKDFIYNNKAKLIYDQLIEISGLDRRKVEFRPTNTQSVKLPLGIHPKTHRRCWFVDRDTLEPIEDFDYIYTTQVVDNELLNTIADRIFVKKLAEMYKACKKTSKAARAAQPFSGFDITESGTRHALQCRYAIWRRQHGATQSQLVEDQMSWYERQDVSLISSTRDEVFADALCIADWCMKNVKVLDREFAPKPAPVARITQQDLAYILGAKTPVYRKVAFYICIYCKRYGEIKVAYDTIAGKIGTSRVQVIRAIDWLTQNHYIEKTNCASNYLKDSNQYTLSYGTSVPLIPKRYRKREYVETDEWITDQAFTTIYATILAQLCTGAYLKKIMKPEEYTEWEISKNGQTM